ncbi:MAG TPA: hypothetical protein VFU05_01770 [Cyclobacteriaceae bacterium]|nr:hypothetical protein [Cyclobacteriaceae bacterium]
MKIQINDHRKIFAIQEEFNNLFPRLKIEFLGKPNKTGSPAPKKIHKPGKKISDCRIKHTSGELTISPNMTIADLKQILSDKYGLTIKLFRQSGTEWLETTDNNKLSLEEQNQGMSL